MFGKTTNSKKIRGLFNKIFDEQFMISHEEYDSPTEYFQMIKDDIYDEISPQLRVLWETLEYIFRLKIDLSIIDLIEFHFLSFIYNALMEATMFFEDEEFEDGFIADFEKAKDSNDDKSIKELVEKYEMIIYHEFEKNDVLGIYDTFEKMESEVNFKVNLLEKKIRNGAYDFINKVDYLKLKNLIILHLILRSFVNKILPGLKDLFDYEKERVDKITDSKFLKVIKESNFPEIQSALVLEKNNIVPIRLTKIFKLRDCYVIT